MFLVAPLDNNRWVYTMHGLEKPMDHVSAGGLMAGSVATLAVLWVSLQMMGLLGHSHSIGAYKLPVSLQSYLASYSGLPAPNSGNAIGAAGRARGQQYPPIDEQTLNSSIGFAQFLMGRMNTLERNIASAGVGVPSGSPGEKQLLNSFPSTDAFQRSVNAIIVAKASLRLVDEACRKFRLDSEECARYISAHSLEGTPLASACPSAQVISCNPRARYRSIDGTCNNLENPSWGSAMTAYTRILFPDYLDGIQQPRNTLSVMSRAPSARAVSVAVTAPNDQSDPSRTLAVMQWSQFIAHDLAHTSVRKMVSSGKSIYCCESNGNSLSPRHIHPDCSPINVADEDPVYGDEFIRCMNYVRSLPAIRSDCSFGPVEQMNEVSHFLDGSAIYGSTLMKSRELRTFSGGRLRMDSRNSHDYLPVGNGDFGAKCTQNCYKSGDDRVNVHPQLAVMHTIWHREHNRIADGLAKVNPEWSDEILYQEARRIVIAEIQHITYKEWLPILLGKRHIRALGLTVGDSYSRNYHSDVDPAVSNEVATAALRFLHSLMQGKLSLVDHSRRTTGTLQLVEHFFKPSVIESDDVFDGLLRGLATQPSQKMDASVISDITSKLYANNKGSLGLDAISLDIQRGRDHGLRGYNHYRKHCGLPEIKSFDDLADHIPQKVITKLRGLYSNTDNIDLIIGGIAERSEDNGLLGPTFRCLIAQEFARLRATDRFFYDSISQPHPFTPEQLTQIRKVTLARVFCDNGNGITRMQPNVFIKQKPGNELKSCTDFEAIPSIDLFAWAERAKAYR